MDIDIKRQLRELEEVASLVILSHKLNEVVAQYREAPRSEIQGWTVRLAKRVESLMYSELHQANVRGTLQ